MSGIAEFFKRTWTNSQTEDINIEKQLEEKSKYLEKQRAKLRRQIELEIQEKYAAHRRALQDYRVKLTILEEKLSKNELDIEQRLRGISLKEDELSKRELELLTKEEEIIKKARYDIEKYSEKKKKELYVEAEKAKETAKADLEVLQQYKIALHKTEFTIIDWLKRVDRKEQGAFEEIRRDVEEYQKCNQSPPENGYDFERNFASALKRKGFLNVIITKKSGDFGSDILAEKDGVKYVIQCKYYTSSVGIKSVQQVFASKIHYSAHVAVVATNSVFTKSAKVLAEETGVLLWNGLKVQEMLESAAP